MELHVTGYNSAYELGLGDSTQRTSLTQVTGDWLMFVTSGSDTYRFSMGIKADGTLWGVGQNNYNQLGLPDTSYNNLTQIGTDTDWVEVALGSAHSVVRKSSGAVYCAGQNGSGACGLGNTTTPIATHTVVPGGQVYTKIAANGASSFGIRADGTLWGWGSHGSIGALGVGGTTAYYTSPTSLSVYFPTETVTDVSVGNSYGLLISDDGTASGIMRSWGYGINGKLGSGGTSTRTSAQTVGAVTTWSRVFAGAETSFAIRQDGTLWSCGLGTNYASAQASTSQLNSFTQVGTDTDWADAAPTDQGVILRKTDGSLHVIGLNTNGQLGTGTTSNITTLTDIGFNSPDGASGVSSPHGYKTSTVYLTPVLPTGKAVAPTAFVVSSVTGKAVASTAFSVVTTGKAVAPTAFTVQPSGEPEAWTARCLVDGVDVSEQLTGIISVNAEEGAARIATATLAPASGTIAPLDYVGKSIVIDYVPVFSGVGIPQRLFTGLIDTPRYDPVTTLLELKCVDDLQNRVAVLDRSVIESIVGGRFSQAVQGDINDNWDYAKALLTTVAASLDAGVSGGLRVTPWEISTTWETFTDADLLYKSIGQEMPHRVNLVNSVTIEFDYRYPRLRQRYTVAGWSGTNIDMKPCGWQYPTQQDIEAAASSSGWKITLGVYYPAPARIPHSSGGFIIPPDDAIDMAILHLTQRHSQTVTEHYTIQVLAPESIEQNGELPYAIRGALQSSFDGRAWESALDVEPLMPSGGEQDYSPDATRIDSDYAISTLLDQARVKILGSHRSGSVSNMLPCMPALDLDKRVAIDTLGVTASGKVSRFEHRLNLETGSAITEFSIACFGVGGAGIITPDSLDPPPPPDPAEETQAWGDEIPAMFVNTYGVTPYTDNLMGLLINPPETITVEEVPGEGTVQVPNSFYTAGSYPVNGFRVRMPGVNDADRNPVVKPVDQSYQILIPSDPITFTVP